METISNAVAGVTNVASKAIWGDQTNKPVEGSEPVSGELGNVKAGEPYDAGNTEATKTNTTTTSDAPSSELPSTAAHTDPKPVSAPLTSTTADSIAPGTVTAPVGDAKDDKTNAATQAAILSLTDDTKDLKIGEKSGDGLVSAKKVDAGEGVNTGVKPESGLTVSKEPIGVSDSTTKSTNIGTTAATDKSATTSTTPAAVAGASSTPTTARKSTSSSSSDDGVDENGQKKKKLSLKEKIKAKLHKH